MTHVPSLKRDMGVALCTALAGARCATGPHHTVLDRLATDSAREQPQELQQNSKKNRAKPIWNAVCFCAVTYLSCVSPSPAETGLRVSVDGNLLSADINGATLEETLREIARITGIGYSISNPALGQAPVSRHYHGIELEAAIRDLVGPAHVLVFDEVGARRQIKKVIVVGSGLAANPANSVKFSIGYGSGESELGVIVGREGASRGPNSFAVDSSGNYWVCDTVNRRLQVFDRSGKHLRSIDLGGLEPSDVAVDGEGRTLVYGTDDTLTLLDEAGKPMGTLSVDRDRWDSRGPMRIVGDSIYVRGSGRGDVLIGRLESGRLQGPTEADLRSENNVGYFGQGGERFVPAIDRDNRVGEIEIDRPDGSRTLVSAPFDNLLSLEFLGQDERGRFHVKAETDEGDAIGVKVAAFDDSGSHLRTIDLDPADYDFFAIRTVAVNSLGDVFLMASGARNAAFQSVKSE